MAAPCRITAREAKRFPLGVLRIATNAIVKPSVTIDLSADVTIHEHAEIQDEVMIFTHKHHWGHSRGLRKEIERVEAVPLVIEKDVFIGTRAMLIGVSKIGKGAVIGAGSVITKDAPPYEMWAGVPGRKIGERKEDTNN